MNALKQAKTAMKAAKKASGDFKPNCIVVPKENLAVLHAATKKVRGRGSETQSHLAATAYLRKLDEEIEAVRTHLNEAWIWLDGSKSFRKCLRHADHAQQRLHRVIKKLEK